MTAKVNTKVKHWTKHKKINVLHEFGIKWTREYIVKDSKQRIEDSIKYNVISSLIYNSYKQSLLINNCSSRFAVDKLHIF